MPLFENRGKDPIDRVRRSLYTRKIYNANEVRHDVHVPQDDAVASEWSDKETPKKNFDLPSPKKTYRVIFWWALSLFIISVGVAAYSFFGGSVFVSSDNVDMTIVGPATVAGGDPTNWSISVENKNKTDIEGVDLIAEFPVGTKDPSAPTQDLGKKDISLGTINASQVAQGNFQAIFFGAQGDTQTIKFTVEYRTADSNAVFYKEKDIPISISSSPISVSINGLDSVNSGQPMTLALTISSNSTNILNNVALEVDYPFGWTTLATDPNPSVAQNIWNLADLAAGATTTISISGSINGQNGDSDAIRATAGIASTEGTIGTAIASTVHTVSIEKPFLAATISLDGQSSDTYAAPIGKTINATIDWQNTGLTRITNGQIIVALDGNALDPSSVNTSDGYYNSQTNTITWSGGRVSDLADIAPGASGEFHFSFTSLPNISNMNNASISLDLSASGQRTDESNVTQNISSESTQTVKIVSNISIASRAMRTSQLMQNSGPFPPKENQTTNYTIIWTAADTSNGASGTKVYATLPPDVTFTGIMSPSNADVSYSSSTGAIIWNLGTLSPSATQELDFQVALTPSANQVGSSADLVSGATITGTDNFADVTVQSSAPALTTLITSDPSFVSGDEVVGQ